MHWLLNWYKQHLFNSCVTAAGGKKAIAMLFYKSLCHRRAMFCSKAGPLANGLLDVVETMRAGCHDDIHEWAGFDALATNTILLRGFSHLTVPCSHHHCLLEVAESQ